MNTAQENDLLSELARLEKCLETPVVPGELPGWLEAAKQSSNEVAALLPREISQRHGQMLQAMLDEDAELAARVEELKAKDQELLAQWDDIHHELSRLDEISVEIEPHEGKFDTHLQQFVDKALAFVIEARKQEHALTTWYTESITRDRGVAD